MPCRPHADEPLPSRGQREGNRYQLIGDLEERQPGQVEAKPIRREPTERALERTGAAGKEKEIDFPNCEQHCQ